MTVDTRPMSAHLRDLLEENARLRHFAELVCLLQQPEGMARFRTTHDLVDAAHDALRRPS